MLDMGILYFYQKPLVSGFTIENEVACVWSDTEAFIGTFQEVQTMMSGIPGKTWISNLQKTYGHVSRPKEISSFLKFLDESDVVLQDKYGVNLDAVFSLYSFNQLGEEQLKSMYSHLQNAIEVAVEFLKLESPIQLVKPQLTMPINVGINAISSAQINKIAELQKCKQHFLEYVKNRNSIIITNVFQPQVSLLKQLLPLSLPVEDEYEINSFDQYSLDELLEKCALIEVCLTDSTEILQNIFSVKGQTTSYIAPKILKMLINLNFINISQCLNVLIFDEAEYCDLPLQLQNDLAELAVSNQIIAMLIIDNFALFKADTALSKFVFQMTFTQFLWAKSFLLLDEITQSGFNCFTVAMNSLSTVVEKSQIKDYMTMCYSKLLDIDNIAYHTYKKS